MIPPAHRLWYDLINETNIIFPKPARHCRRYEYLLACHSHPSLVQSAPQVAWACAQACERESRNLARPFRKMKVQCTNSRWSRERKIKLSEQSQKKMYFSPVGNEMSSVLVAVCDATRVASGVEPTKVSLSQALNRVKFPDSFATKWVNYSIWVRYQSQLELNSKNLTPVTQVSNLRCDPVCFH